MSFTGFIVLFAVIWFLTLWCALPVGLRTQGDDGDIVPGTSAGAPNNLRLGRKMMWVTIIAFAVWAPIVYLISSGIISIYDLDFWNQLEDADF